MSRKYSGYKLWFILGPTRNHSPYRKYHTNIQLTLKTEYKYTIKPSKPDWSLTFMTPFEIEAALHTWANRLSTIGRLSVNVPDDVLLVRSLRAGGLEVFHQINYQTTINQLSDDIRHQEGAGLDESFCLP